MMRLYPLALAALVSITAGCLSHREYRHVYSLEAAVDAPAQAGVAEQHPVLRIQRVLIPDYLDTTGIQLRVGAHEIHESAAGRFGERLSLGVAHALQSDLASRLPGYSVVLAQSADGPGREILVTVDAFDVWPTGRCVLAADWTVLDADRRTVLVADRGTFETAAAGSMDLGDGAIVAAMADAVRQLAGGIASSVAGSQR